MYVLEGEIDYFYKDLDSEKIEYLKVKKDQNIFTPPMEIHATYFPIHTKIIVSSLNPRDQETYERDTVRVEFVNEENIRELLNTFAV
jgi:hypothetical protein|tara:strand:+ start:301 stop:561 length:261 start_codon:yes stop_codon:yes gene_type:complete